MPSKVTLGRGRFEGRDLILQLSKSCQRGHKFVTTLRDTFTFVQKGFINSSNGGT